MRRRKRGRMPEERACSHSCLCFCFLMNSCISAVEFRRMLECYSPKWAQPDIWRVHLLWIWKVKAMREAWGIRNEEKERQGLLSDIKHRLLKRCWNERSVALFIIQKVFVVVVKVLVQELLSSSACCHLEPCILLPFRISSSSVLQPVPLKSCWMVLFIF